MTALAVLTSFFYGREGKVVMPQTGTVTCYGGFKIWRRHQPQNELVEGVTGRYVGREAHLWKGTFVEEGNMNSVDILHNRHEASMWCNRLTCSI
jgi:hypothetical protein